MSDDLKDDIIKAVINSINAALSDDPPADWKASLADGADALRALLEA